MCCSLQRSEDSLASSQESHGPMHCVPTVSSPQCCSRISSRMAPRRTRAERVLGGSQRPPGWKALGGLPDQAHSSSLAITACTERRRLPTPTGQPRGDDAYFFAAGNMNYARYMTWYLRNIENLPTTPKNDLVKGAHRCRHTDGGTAVPVEQFGEQTYIRRGKGAGVLRGISTNVEQVAVWVGSFSVCAHLDLAIEAMYCHDDAGGKPVGGTEGDCKTLNKYKEEGERRRKMDETDRNKIAVELQKHLHPLTVK